MSENKIAYRYAKSLFDAAKSSNTVDVVNSDMQSFLQICQENKDLVDALKSPIVSIAQKSVLLSKVFAGFNADSLKLFQLVASKNRSSIIRNIATQFTTLFNTERGIIEADIVSANALTDTESKKVVAYLEKQTGAKEIKINATVNTDLIGGMIIKYGDLLIDNSIQSQIKTLKKELQII